MTGERRLGIGMVGAGTMASAHSLALAARQDLRGRAAATASRGSRRRQRPPRVTLAARYGYERVEPDWRHLVGADIDLVVGCLPPTHNHEVMLAAATAGKHVVSEKPLATTAEAGAELLRAAGGRRVPRSWRRLSLDAGAPGDPLDAGTGRARRGAQPARVVPARLRRRPRGAAPLALPAIDGRWRDRDRHGLPPRRLRALPGRRARRSRD